VHVITPTAHPLESLAASLTRQSESVTATATLIDDLAKDPRSLHLYARKLLSLSGEARLLLVVDQFEETFTLCKDPGERKAFVENLLTASSTRAPGRCSWCSPYGPIFTITAPSTRACAWPCRSTRPTSAL